MLFAAPLIRGGNRHAALVVLELLGIALLVGLWMRSRRSAPGAHCARPGWPVLALALSPLLLAILQLTPLPAGLWVRLPGRDVYPQALGDAGVAMGAWLPLSVSPTATAASLLAGIPIAAIFMFGNLASLPQLRLALRTVVAVAFVQVALAMLQVAGGAASPLYFGLAGGRPVGTFANSNHYGNYLVMCLVAFIWLCYYSRRTAPPMSATSIQWRRNQMILAAAGGLVLVLGIVMSLSRGAAVFGLPCAVAAVVIVALRLRGLMAGARLAAVACTALLLCAVALLGVDTATSRASAGDFSTAAGYRVRLATTTLEGAKAFLPFGAGWGSYDQVYQRFQPPEIAAFANHAHMDYAELLLEGGLPFVGLAGIFLWLSYQRAAMLVRLARRDRTLNSEAMASALCGLGVLALLLHSLVEFNMRIPANAILGALLAGVFLRPLAAAPGSHDRSAQPHPAGH